jgi:hypothetical protein
LTRFIETHVRSATALCGIAALAVLLLAAGRAGAATSVYPAGGNGFDSSAEGWSPGATSCAPAALLCTPEATYDSSTGNPPGSIAARTTVTLNLLGLFQGSETWSSPQFTLPVGAVTGASVHLDRAFSPGGLVDVEPTGTYTVTLNDLTAGTSAVPLTEKLTKDDTTFASRSGSASVVGGHTYQLSIESVTAQSTVALSALNGTTALHFDNVGLSVQTAGGGGGGGGGKGASGANGGSGLTDSRLLSLLQSSSGGTAVLKGKRLFVKAPCPAKVGRSCHLSLQGLLKKHRPATARRTSKVAKGKAKRLALKVKPKARAKVQARKRLLFKETVRAGKARATVFKRLKLIRR